MTVRFLFKPLLIVITIVILSLSRFNFVSSEGFFSDVPASSLYSPHIESLYSAHFITGDTVMGIPSGTFRPDDTINRAEFAKISSIIRLAELYGISEKWNGKPELEILESVNDKLRYFYRCDNTDTPECSIKKGADITNVCNVCSSIGGTPFSDVSEKEWGCEEEGICDPWFTQYIYYAVAKGFIKGYPDKTFKPYNPIIRIHALKMILSDNGTTDDSRFQSLKSIADSRGSSSPRCLFGADKYILDNNAGDTDLLSFALLSDRLGLFGNDCSVFGSSTTPKQRADFLQRSLTRKEAPRYYALTTSYYPISADPGSAPKEDIATEPDKEADIPIETDVEEADKIVETKTQTTVHPLESVTSENNLADITLSSSSAIALTDENGRSCGAIPADTEFGLLVARKGTDGKFYQYVDYKDLINCRFLCDTLMTTACKEAIALQTELVASLIPVKTKKTGEKPAIITTVRAGKDLIAEVGRQCNGSKEVCAWLQSLLANYNIDVKLFSGCNGDDRCNAKRILDNFLSVMERMEGLLKKVKNGVKDIKPKAEEITKPSLGDRSFKTSVKDVNIRAEAKTKAYLLKKIPDPKTEITVIGPAIVGEYVDDYKTDRWYPVRCEGCEDGNGNKMDYGYILATLIHPDFIDFEYKRSNVDCNSYGTRQANASLNRVVIHATAGSSVSASSAANSFVLASYMQDGDTYNYCSGAHFYIGRDGDIVQVRPVNELIHHAGPGSVLTWNKNLRTYFSLNSIGIEMVNFGTITNQDSQELTDVSSEEWKVWDAGWKWGNFGTDQNGKGLVETAKKWQPYTDNQYKALNLLLDYLGESADIPKSIFIYDPFKNDEADKGKYSNYAHAYFPPDTGGRGDEPEELTRYYSELDNFSGVITHHNATGKWDTGPIFDIYNYQIQFNNIEVVNKH